MIYTHIPNRKGLGYDIVVLGSQEYIETVKTRFKADARLNQLNKESALSSLDLAFIRVRRLKMKMRSCTDRERKKKIDNGIIAEIIVGRDDVPSGGMGAYYDGMSEIMGCSPATINRKVAAFMRSLKDE